MGSPFDTGSRAQQCSYLLNEVQKLVVSFIDAADQDAKNKHTGTGLRRIDGPGTTILSTHSGPELSQILNLNIPDIGQGSSGLLDAIQMTLKYSVNTWDRGFMDKLYASTDAVGIAAELILATLNTNVHVYSVSPALTIIEKTVTKALAGMFGLQAEHSGGVSMQGGAASNQTSLLVARNYRYPKVKMKGMRILLKPLAIFTSSEAHYSVSTAATSLGFGTDAVYSVPIDRHGRMDTKVLQEKIDEARRDGFEPFYVSATAGTTVRGAYDPLEEIGQICREQKLWFHVDAAWGGPAVFSRSQKYKLTGSQLADTIACNPHKMMGVPTTCSFLLGQDLRKFYVANSLNAGYLFHDDPEDAESAPRAGNEPPAAADVYDLASFTPQCGRRGDSLKLYLSWIYHGTIGYEKQIDAAFDACQYMAEQISKRQEFILVSENPPPCCQCCFYYRSHDSRDSKHNTRTTRAIVAGLVHKGWMIDYAPGESGEFLRVVTNRGTTNEIIDGLIKAILEVGGHLVKN